MPMHWVSTISAVPNTAEKPALAPVDTSPSPWMMTNASPTAMMPYQDMVFMIAARLLRVP